MKLIGSMLLLSGWLIVLAALVMLPALTPRAGFIASGLGVEVLGLVMLTRGYTAAQKGAQ